MRGRSKDLQYFTIYFQSRVLTGMSIPYSYWVLFGKREKFSCEGTLSLLSAIRMLFFNCHLDLVVLRDSTHTYTYRKDTVRNLCHGLYMRECLMSINAACTMSPFWSVVSSVYRSQRLQTRLIISGPLSSIKGHYL